MFSRHEGFFAGHGGTTLFFQVWEHADARGTVIITHGQGEHSDSYARVVEALRSSHVNIWAWDLRGHGRSEGKRGYASSFEDYVLDARLFYRQTLEDKRVAGKPVVLLGHSMGALVQLKALIDFPELRADAQVCSAPLLGVAIPVPAWKETAAGWLNGILPQITLWNEIRNDQLTRDPDVVREFEQDVLRHGRISAGVFLGFAPAFEAVREGAPKLKLPTLFQLAEEDPVISTPAALGVFEKIGAARKELKTYGDGARHEMYNDLHRAVVLADLRAFVESVVDRKGDLR